VGGVQGHGLREIVVGTGGVGFHTAVFQAPNLTVANADTFGALKLTLRPTGYDWPSTWMIADP
jgi:hypothetical protein